MSLRNYIDKIKPNFEEGGKLHAFRSVFEGFETFLYVPNTTSKNGVNIHDSFDSKRMMIMVVIALCPALLFGMYNVGYQHFALAGLLDQATFWNKFWFGFLAVLPRLIVSYVVGLSIEFVVAQWKHEEIQEGYLVSGFIIPLIVPATTPLWILAIAVAFSVIFAKEIFGGTGMNFLNVALIGMTAATALGTAATTAAAPAFTMDMVWGFIPGSVGETSVIAIALGALLLLYTGIASWKTMLSVFAGGILMALVFNQWGPDNAMAQMPWYEHLCLGGFCFGAVFMATDPVTSARTEVGKWIYGLLIGMMAITIRVMNPGYPEGMMLAILLMNCFAPLIDYCVVQRNVNKRANRINK